MTLGMDPSIDVDYTTATNLLVELGFLLLAKMGQPLVETVPGPANREIVSVSSKSVIDALARHMFEALSQERQSKDDQMEWFDAFWRVSPDGSGLIEGLSKLASFQPRKREPAQIEVHEKS